MLRKSLFFILIGAVVAFAQPVINSSNVPGAPGTIISYENTGDLVSVNLGSAGPNQTWNFTSMTTTDTYADYWIDPATTPYMSTFPDANRCFYNEGQEGNYHFFNLTPSAYWSLGMSVDYGDSIVTYEYYDTTPAMNFPTSYQDEWAFVYSYDMDLLFTSVYDSTYNVVDGWGTVIDEMGTYQCLRVKSHLTAITYVMGIPVNTFTYWYYSWDVPNMGAVVSIISDLEETNPNFTMGYFGRIVDINTGIIGPPISLAVDGFELNPAYPNPFNPETKLSFTLPQSGEVTLAIYDASGREVTRLIQGALSGGYYDCTWDASLLPSGAYFARLISGQSLQTQKLMLVK